jgi:DNA polymerase I-like protein with 3'-5' exonuclease and polymerase domains
MSDLIKQQLYWKEDYFLKRAPGPETPAFLFDIETDGLLETVTRIHCMAVKNFLTGEVYAYGPDNIHRGLDCLCSVPLLVAHNGLKFDIRVIEKLYPNVVLPPCFDTLVASRLIWTNLADLDFMNIRRKTANGISGKLVGSHSLGAWGQRLGLLKGDYGKRYAAWERFTPEMLDYCKLDVEVLELLYRKILEQDYSPQALALEHDFQEIIIKQEDTGVLFDREKAAELYAELSAKREELGKKLREVFPVRVVEETFIPKVNNKTRGYVKVVPYIKKHYEEFNPSSRDMIAERLTEKYGWKPSEFTETGKPKLTEDCLKSMPYPEAALLAQHLELTKIIGMLSEGENSWFKFIDNNNRIHGQVITNGAVTGRCTHMKPNMAQIPKQGDYGRKCRELFIAPEGMVQVGADASGLELRMLAHYMAPYDGGKYGEIIINGDIHTENQKAAGLETRDDAKHFIYAFLYGAGDMKLGSLVIPLASPAAQSKKGKVLKDRFFRTIPAMKRLVDAIKRRLDTQKSKFKVLYGLDRRSLHVRSEHSALNTLLQSAGAVLVKTATVIFHQEAKKLGLTGFEQVLHVHDEVQFYCKPEDAEAIGKLFVRSIELAGLHYGIRCPVTGEFKIGKNWSETH